MSQDMPYVYQPWPAWFYGPGGKGQIFERQEDVPEGWTDSRDTAPPADETTAETVERIKADPDAPVVELKRVLTGDQRTAAVLALVDNAAMTQKALVKELEAMYELDDTIEYSSNWPRQKLAETIVDNGGPIEPKE